MTDQTTVALSLAALGHESRLAIYQLLVRAGDDGLNVGEIGQHIGVPASTLAHHLKALVDSGLVIQERHGRQIVNRVDYDAMRSTIAFLTAECCVGVSLSEADAA